MIVTEFELETKESRQPDSQTSGQANSRTVWQFGSPTVGKPDSWKVWQKGQPDSLTDGTPGQSDRPNSWTVWQTGQLDSLTDGTPVQSDRQTVWPFDSRKAWRLDCKTDEQPNRLAVWQFDNQKAWQLDCLTDRQPDGWAVWQLTCRPPAGWFSFWFVNTSCTVWYSRFHCCYFRVDVNIIYEWKGMLALCMFYCK